MKKRNKKIIWLIVILLAVVATWYFVFRKKPVEMVLTTEKPYTGNIATTITATGTIQPVDTVAVGTQVSGTISKVYADFNSTVKKGQLLAELDKTILNAQVQQVSASIAQAQSQLNFQQSNINRQQQLYQAGAISKSALETAQNEFKVSQAGITSVNAQLQAAQKNLSLANIYSPIDGTVLSRNVSEGQTVAASLNTPTLFSIAKDLTHMQVRAAVDEADIGGIQKEQRASFTVDAFPNDIFNGTLLDVRLQPTVSSNVVTYTTIINAPNENLKLKPGMTANITVYIKEQNNVMLISAKATRFKPDSSLMKKYTIVWGNKKEGQRQKTNDSSAVKRASVWVLNGNTITRKTIHTGLEDGTQVQVLDGLAATDVVINGMEQSNGSSAKNKTEAKSPFMPQRRTGGGGGGGNRGGQGGGNRPQ